jgi:hypothetical protein
MHDESGGAGKSFMSGYLQTHHNDLLSQAVLFICISIKKGVDQRGKKCHTKTIRGKKNRYN